MKKISFYSLAFLVGFALHAQNVRIEKSYDRSFFIEDRARVEITNKYGEVIINNWYKDSVRIKVDVLAEGKNQEVVNKEMRRVDIDLRQIGSIVSGVTKFDVGRRGVFGEFLDQVNDYSKSVIGGKRITVDYEVWLPQELDLSIENKFGDIYLSSLDGKVSIDLSHGDLRGNKISNELMLKHSFGKSAFDYIHDGNITFRGIDAKISEAQKLLFESSSSEISLGTAEEIQLVSRNDKYFVDKARNVIGEGTFTDIRIDELTENARLDFDYGEIYLARIDKEFDNIFINGKSCDINMILNQASYINTTIEGDQNRMILPNSMLVMKRENLDNERIKLSGFVGNTNTTHSSLEVRSDGGELLISIKETDIFTNRD